MRYVEIEEISEKSEIAIYYVTYIKKTNKLILIFGNGRRYHMKEMTSYPPNER